jgi:glucose-6-phosphate 1-epimerase
MFRYGGHVAAWTPTGHQPGLHLSGKSVFAPGKAIRGGIPICYPWFGDRTADPKPGGKPSPAHGFARTRPWQVDDVRLEQETGRILVAMSLAPEPALWDAEATARLRCWFGATLEVALTVEDTGGTPCEFEAALHTYLEVGDVRAIRIRGLENTTYIDKVDGFREKRSGSDALVLTDETDRVFVGTTAAVTIVDPVLERQVRVEKTGSACTVVWNPWLAKATAMADVGTDDWPRFVCIEAANTRPHQVSLEPGSSHTMSARIQIAPRPA